MHSNFLLHAMVSALLLVGCAGSARVHGSASVRAPELVYVSPGVQVIADYREPIFYSDQYYWRYSGSVWYRSSNYTGGWVRYQAPRAVLRIERPSAYVYYRGAARATPAHREAPAATSREEQKEAREEQKEHRKEAREEQKEQRKDAKQERKDAKQERKDAKQERK